MIDVKDKEKTKRLITIIFIIIGGLIVGVSCYFYYEFKESERISLEQERINAINLQKENVIKYVQKNVGNLYDENNVPKLGISDEELESIYEDIETIDDEGIRSSLHAELNKIKAFKEVEKKVDLLIINNVLISNYSDEDIEELNNMINELPEEWRIYGNEKMDIINTQKANMNEAKIKVKELFSDANLTKVKSNVTRKKYNSAKTEVDKLVQKDLKNEYNKALEKVLKVVEEKEEQARKEAEEKARKEAEIKAAWIVLETPYISQNKLKIYNGCEGAALLMGLQYKGYLKGTTLKTFVDNMPKSEDDPHEGFVRDIYEFEPRDVPHWIAPDALARYGRSASGNNGVVDITGTSVDGLKRELDKGNPVVIYATGGNFDDPVNWVEEVPKNVHVMLLIGYNPVSKQMVINDPWTKTSTGKVYISESRFTEIYNIIGKKAVVIR